jgi:hypothetical protein
MVVAVRRGKPGLHGEDVIKLLEQRHHQISQCHHADSGQDIVRGHAVPLHVVVVAPTAQAGMDKIPEDGTKSAQPLDTEYHLIASMNSSESM